MKKVLYVSNIEVPYRTQFFNELSKECQLTVLYERKQSKNRNKNWTTSIKKGNYNVKYLNGINIKNENSFNLKIFKYLFSREYDVIIFGCYNSLVQMISILVMKIFRKKYYLNLDGEIFANGNKAKDKVKRFFLKGAEKYLVAGEKSANNVKLLTKSTNVYPYYFSSLTEKELKENKKKFKQNKKRENYILSVGQYFDYKGLDILLEVAKAEPKIKFKFIGTGNKTNEFKQKVNELKLKNVDVIPFLQKRELEQEYLKCKMLVLPSRQECWGLVINEAASYGTPVVSTYGSGAAVEFLYDQYDCLLAKQNDSFDLKEKINFYLKNEINENFKKQYESYLIKTSMKYSIEQSVKNYIKVINNL